MLPCRLGFRMTLVLPAELSLAKLEPPLARLFCTEYVYIYLEPSFSMLSRDRAIASSPNLIYWWVKFDRIRADYAPNQVILVVKIAN